MEDYSLRIKKAKKELNNADYIIIGAGAGLSAAAGLDFTGKLFKKNFKEYIEKYDFKDLYSATFYPFKTQEEKWAFWAKVIKLNRLCEPLSLYKELLELVKDKAHFVFTTNVDGQFEIAGFREENIFEIQGDYSLIQCQKACHNKVYDIKDIVDEWLELTEDFKIPEDLIPKCPVCGADMEMNLRKDNTFVQDENWYRQSKRFSDFLEKTANGKLVLLEIGVGFNTPGIIRFPFEQMTQARENTKLIRINKDYPETMLKIENKTISFMEDTNKIISDLK